MSSPEPRRLRGGCLCGAVAYEVEDGFRYALACHCSQCRRATGSAFKPFGGIERERFVLTAGADRLLIHGDAPTLRVQAHIMVAHKAPWFEITDDLPQNEEF